jgi:hypothetical protein
MQAGSVQERSMKARTTRGAGWRLLAAAVMLAGALGGAEAQSSVLFATGNASPDTSLPDAPGSLPSSPHALQQLEPCALHGVVEDSNGSLVPGATVLLDDGHGHRHSVQTDGEGEFELTDLDPGVWVLTASAPGLTVSRQTVEIGPGQVLDLEAIPLKIASVTAIQVTATRTEIAQAEVQLEEKQRVFGIFPNYYVTYVGEALPLDKRQKFSLAMRLEFDPVSIALDGVVAGVQQATNSFSGYGQGASGYFKRFGAVFADNLDATFMAGAVLPSLLRQDPRYYWRGHGTVRQRTLYAIAQVVICKGDNGHWQPNYSNVGGNLIAAGISNAYYPASNRHGASLTIENALLGTAGGAVGNIIQEFLIHHITPNIPDYEEGEVAQRNQTAATPSSPR